MAEEPRVTDLQLQMQKLYDDTMQPLDKRPCAGLRTELKACLLSSDCVRVQKRTPRECLSSTDGSVSKECILLRQTFFECKRSLLDNRQRFRGRKGY